ncbi:MAG: hypothetical protein H7321_01065 [Bacteroidia bacterium]|nr:hypothetical protein [Bacteroidia bacterium]
MKSKPCLVFFCLIFSFFVVEAQPYIYKRVSFKIGTNGLSLEAPLKGRFTVEGTYRNIEIGVFNSNHVRNIRGQVKIYFMELEMKRSKEAHYFTIGFNDFKRDMYSYGGGLLSPAEGIGKYNVFRFTWGYGIRLRFFESRISFEQDLVTRENSYTQKGSKKSNKWIASPFAITVSFSLNLININTTGKKYEKVQQNLPGNDRVIKNRY